MGFARFQLSPSLFNAITNLGYAEPTPVQAQTIPEALKGRDIRACAQTGTGKTCAFVVPIIEKFTKHRPVNKPSALILTPTRELAAQVLTVVQGLSKGSSLRHALILGGANINQQIQQLRQGADIVVATPGRLIDLLNRNAFSLKHIQMVVLDEADRMLDMGFLPDIKRIFQQLPFQKQTMLFSATFGPEVKNITNQFLKNPAVVDISPASTATSANVTQMVYPVPQGQKKAFLQALLEINNMTSALIFTRTKNGANKLLITLRDWGKKAAVIHSNRSQNQRQQALQGFKDRRYQILVATDIAARGIDVKDISHVINYDVPRHAEDYVHRIGRTGRAQSVGEAFTLVSPDEEQFIRRIEGFIKKSIPRGVINDFPYQSKPKVFVKPAMPHTPSHTPHQRPQHPSHHRHQRPRNMYSQRPAQSSHSSQAPHNAHPSQGSQQSHPAQHKPAGSHPQQHPKPHGHQNKHQKRKFWWKKKPHHS